MHIHRVLLVTVQIASLSHVALLIVAWALGNSHKIGVGRLVVWPAILLVFGLAVTSSACEAWLVQLGFEHSPRPAWMAAVLLAQVCSLTAYGQLCL